MTTDEHDAAIIAKCRELLALAAKRTPGEWAISKLAIPQIDSSRGAVAKAIIPLEFTNPTVAQYDERDNNSTYIAACAGPAEAGWLSTIAAIELCHQLPSPDSSLILARIRAAWPKDLLNQL